MEQKEGESEYSFEGKPSQATKKEVNEKMKKVKGKY